MKLETIFELWNEDANMDRSDLSNEQLKVSKLHHKYYQIYVNERLVLKKLEADLKILKLEKYEFYTQGPTKETEEKGWKLPSIGKIIKSELSHYLEADKDLINLSLRIGMQNEKIGLLESIIKLISTRNFAVKNIIDWEKFTNGGY